MGHGPYDHDATNLKGLNMANTVKEFTKRVSDNLDYDFDYTDFLGAVGDTISGSTAPTIVASPSGLTLGTKSNTSTKVKQWISGGTQGQTYSVVCTMTSTGGRVRSLEMKLTISGA